MLIKQKPFPISKRGATTPLTQHPIVALLSLAIFFLISFVSCKKENETIIKKSSEYFTTEEINACMGMPRPTDAYNYPIRPGSAQWKAFKTTQEMIDACQLPAPLLMSISTQGLIQACWENSIFPETAIFGIDYPQKGFDNGWYNFNCYTELIKRKDAGLLLYKRYLLLNPLCKSLVWQYLAFEIFLSQNVFLETLEKADLKAIVSHAVENDRIKQLVPEQANSCTRVYTFLLIARTLQAYDYAPFMKEMEQNETLSSFTKTGILMFKEVEKYPAFYNMISTYAQSLAE